MSEESEIEDAVAAFRRDPAMGKPEPAESLQEAWERQERALVAKPAPATDWRQAWPSEPQFREVFEAEKAAMAAQAFQQDYPNQLGSLGGQLLGPQGGISTGDAGLDVALGLGNFSRPGITVAEWRRLYGNG
jgi:hypothetical protein